MMSGRGVRQRPTEHFNGVLGEEERIDNAFQTGTRRNGWRLWRRGQTPGLRAGQVEFPNSRSCQTAHSAELVGWPVIFGRRNVYGARTSIKAVYQGAVLAPSSSYPPSSSRVHLRGCILFADMRQIRLLPVLALATSACIGWAQSAPAAGPYRVLKTAKVGGDGGFDYVYADEAGRRLYIARTGQTPRITVFNLDTLDSAGEIAKTAAHGVAVSTKTHHGFASSKPVAMFDSKTLEPIKTIDVQGNPDGIMHDDFNDKIYIFSHSKPNVTVINPEDGSIAGTIDLGGAPEQAASDGKGKVYVDLEDTDKVAVIDAKTMAMTGSYDLSGKGGGCAGLAMDPKNGILFASCRNPQNMVVLTAEGKILTTLPIGAGTDGAV